MKRGFRSNAIIGNAESAPTSINFLTGTVNADWVLSNCSISTHTATNLKFEGNNSFYAYCNKPIKIKYDTQKLILTGDQTLPSGSSNTVYVEVSTDKISWTRVGSTSNYNQNFNINLSAYKGKTIYVKYGRSASGYGNGMIYSFGITES